MPTPFRPTIVLTLAAMFLPACLCGQSSAATPPAAVFQRQGPEQVSSLNGLWRFKPGDDPHFANASYDDSAWTLLRSDASWNAQGYPALTGFAWYRFRIVLPAGSERQSLLLPSITSGYQCFLDGKLLHTEGAVKQQGTARYSMPAAIDLPLAKRASDQTYVVALRVWFDPLLDGSAAGGSDGSSIAIASAGSATAVHDRLSDFFALQRQKATVKLDLSLLFLLAGIICVPLFLMQRSSPEYFWYGIAATSYAAETALYFDQFTHRWPISAFLFASSLFDAGTSIGLIVFFSYLLRLKRGWSTALVLAVDVVGLSSSLLQNYGLISIDTSNALIAIGGCVFSGWVIGSVARRAFQRMLDAMLLLLPVSLDFGLLFVNSLRAALPAAGQPLENLAQHVLLTYPFLVKVNDVTSAFVLLALVLVLLNRFARIQREHARITADMSAARSIQHLLIPNVLPAIAGLEIEAAYHPALEVGGDFFQVIPVASGRTLVVLGDVSGKGLPAAMTVSLIVGVVRTLVEFTTSPGTILAGLNAHLIGRGTGFTTCLAIEIAADGTLAFANAGQLAPYRNGVEVPSEGALPLGIMPGLTFPESRLRLVPGDRLTLMTDGIPEAASDREMFGFLRTEELSQQPAERIAEAAQRFGQTDDITVLSIKFNGQQS